MDFKSALLLNNKFMNPAINETTTQPEPSEADKKFEATESEFKEKEVKIAALRAFLVKYREPLSLFLNWKAFAFHGDIDFSNYDSKQKEIARAFGADGWVRKKHSYTCGAINWEKTLDGVKLTIESAEQINPKLIEEVKL
jgi:hypothetical protein